MAKPSLLLSLQRHSASTVDGVAMALEILAVETEDGRLVTGAVDGGPEKLRYAAEALRRGEAGSAFEALRVVNRLSYAEVPLQVLKRALRRLCLTGSGSGRGKRE